MVTLLNWVLLALATLAWSTMLLCKNYQTCLEHHSVILNLANLGHSHCVAESILYLHCTKCLVANGHVNTTPSSSTSILKSVQESVCGRVHTPTQSTESRFHINSIVAGTGDKSELVHTLCTLLHAYIIQHSY